VVVVDGRHHLESKITEHYLRKVLGPETRRLWPWQR
jgi:hypothetical protein